MTRVPVRRAFAAGLGAATLAATVVAGATSAGAAPKRPAPSAPPVQLQLLALNDFHGQLEPPTGSSSRLPGFPTTRENVPPSASNPQGNTTGFGGVEYLASQVRRLEQAAAQPNTLTVAAGDLIGATPLLSAAFHDEPTIEALNRIGLDYATVGNHEFDEGPEELLRIAQSQDCHQDGCTDGAYEGADFEYLSANAFVRSSGQPLLAPYAVHDVQGIKVGFIGMTLEGTPGVVTPSGVQGLTFGDEADVANRYVLELKKQGVETIVVLLHEGGRQSTATDVDGCTGLGGAITGIVPRMSPEIDAVITGHSHEAYNCREHEGQFFQSSTTDKGRLVTSASSVGRLVTDIDLQLDPRTGDVVGAVADNVPVEKSAGAAPDLTELIAKWRTLLGPIAGQVVGNAAEDIRRAQERLYQSGVDSRGNPVYQGGESPLGKLIADAQLAATPGSQAALMNPGGVRADVLAGEITYEEAFAVQPFGNFLTQITMTDSQIQCLLEQQFALGTVLQPAGLAYTVDRAGTSASRETPCQGSRVPDESVTIGGVPIATDAAGSYRITVNNFLADGGDSFSTFTGATNRVDVVSPEDDLAALVQYLRDKVVSGPADRRVVAIG